MVGVGPLGVAMVLGGAGVREECASDADKDRDVADRCQHRHHHDAPEQRGGLERVVDLVEKGLFRGEAQGERQASHGIRGEDADQREVAVRPPEALQL